MKNVDWLIIRLSECPGASPSPNPIKKQTKAYLKTISTLASWGVMGNVSQNLVMWTVTSVRVITLILRINHSRQKIPGFVFTRRR